MIIRYMNKYNAVHVLVKLEAKMPRKNIEAIQIHVPQGTREKIKSYAESKKYAVFSDYIRELIEKDMRAAGVDIDLNVDRGGYRERSNDED
jgi:hypothetical protein